MGRHRGMRTATAVNSAIFTACPPGLASRRTGVPPVRRPQARRLCDDELPSYPGPASEATATENAPAGGAPPTKDTCCHVVSLLRQEHEPSLRDEPPCKPRPKPPGPCSPP